MKLNVTTTLFFILLFFGVFSQKVFEDYQDGLIVFELQQEAKAIVANEHNEFNINDVHYLSSIYNIDVKSSIQLHPSINDKRLKRTYQIELNNPYEIEEVIRTLSSIKEIRVAEKKELPRILQVPDDPLYTQANMWGLFRVQAEGAWAFSTGDASIVVAVTDDAIQTNHPDLVNKVLPGHNSAMGTNDPNPCGGNNGFHGSHVSGTVGADTDNGIGVASIGWDISILPVAIGRCSDGALTGGFDGIIWSADNGADVINMSWGGAGSSQYGQNVCNYAWNQGCILVAAAGNNNENQQFYPAAYNNVISVAATGQQDQKANFSQFGTWIDISAPGTQIASTDEGTGYQFSQGTSMASPLVAGFMGLMKSFAPNASNSDLVQCLYDGADNIDAQNPNFIGQLGAGRMNAEQSMICAQQFSFQLDAGITEIIHPVGNNCDLSFTPEVRLSNFGVENLTSIIINYGWNNNNHSYNWSGNLSSGESEIVSLGTYSDVDGSYSFFAETNQPNGQADQNPSNDSSDESFSLSSGGMVVDITITLDCFADETSWEIVNDNTGEVIISSGNYENNNVNVEQQYKVCLSDGCYDFIIYDSYGDGLNGSQWQSCSVDGDYEVTDENDNILVQMTAPNGDFGSQAIHNFCIVNQNNEHDAGIQSITSPSSIVCNTDVSPEVIIRNFGSQNLTSVDINYQLSGNLQTFNWVGNLSTGQTDVVLLPIVNATSGENTLTVFTSNPNGENDDNPLNDQAEISLTAFSSTQGIPFHEDFEGSPFGPNGWLIDNPDNGITWELESIDGNSPGNTAMKIDFFNYQANSERDALISPPISLSGYTTIDLNFEHAYRRYDQTAADSLVVYISTDCGESFQRLAEYAEDGSGSFATQTTNVNPFTPQSANDWCIEPINAQTSGASCFTISLNDYVGMDVILKFESFNAGNVGNNLFIDNINIDGVPDMTPPNPNFSTDNNTICVNESVLFTDQSSPQATSWNWTFPGGSPSSSTEQNPTITYSENGTYDVILEVSNANGTETSTFSNTITVNNMPTIAITASETSICQGSSVQISASGANNYVWNNNLGSGSTKTVSPTEETTYEVTGSNGAACESSETITINVLPELVFELSASTNLICEGEEVVLTASGGDFYTWNNGLPQGNQQTVSPSTTTVYSVQGFNASNCSGTQSILIEVQQDPIVNITASDTEICEGESLSLSASGADTYTWSPSESLSSSSGSSVNATPTNSVTYTVIGSNNCGSDEQDISIIVTETPETPEITQNGNELSVSINPGETASWFFEGELIGSGETIGMQGTGDYEVVISNSTGCTASYSNRFESTVSVHDFDNSKNIILYPNPNNGEFNIEIVGLDENVEISISDATGRLVRNAKPFNANEIQDIKFNIADLGKGVYFVHINYSFGNIVKRVTVN